MRSHLKSLKPVIKIAGSAVLLASLFSGCEDKSKHTQAAPPAAASAPTIAAAPAPKPAEPAPVAAPKVDTVDATIEQSEREYQQGQSEYKAGHLEAAKQHFDAAMNVLMSGKNDVRSDERLQREFDKIVEGVNKLEMVAFKQGDGFTEQKAEPAPIDEANEVTFPVDPAIKAKAEQEVQEIRSDLPLVMNDYVAGYISFFTN